MAWEHFTEEAIPGGIFTAAQWGELLDALDERIKSVGDPGDGVLDKAALKASGVVTSALGYRWKGADYTNTIWAAVQAISPSFWIAPGSNLGGPVTLAAVAAALGVSIAAVSAVLTAVATTRLDIALYWNVVRAAIRLCSIIRIPLDGLSRLQKWGAAYGDTWSESLWYQARDACLVAPEVSSPSYLSTSPHYVVSVGHRQYVSSWAAVQRNVISATLPSFGLGAPAKVWVKIAGVPDFDMVAGDRFVISCNGATTYLDGYGVAAVEGVPAGPVLIDIRLESYDSLEKLEMYHPDGAVRSRLYGGTAWDYYITGAGWYIGYLWVESPFSHP